VARQSRCIGARQTVAVGKLLKFSGGSDQERLTCPMVGQHEPGFDKTRARTTFSTMTLPQGRLVVTLYPTFSCCHADLYLYLTVSLPRKGSTDWKGSFTQTHSRV